MKRKIFVAGHLGMVGSAVVRHLVSTGVQASQIITRSRRELDLLDTDAVSKFFKLERPDQVYLAAARVGGILANDMYPAEYIYENIVIQTNVINEAFKAGVRDLLFLGSSCIYPRLADQPIKEEALLTGYLEPTNESYAIAKIAGIKMCESYNRQYGNSHGICYRCVMPTNLYGPGDSYDPNQAHVLPALIKKFHEAKEADSSSVDIWGTGKPKREFLFVDDLAAACVHIMNLPPHSYKRHTTPTVSHINVGSGVELTISELAHAIARLVRYEGKIFYDQSKPDGAPRKLLDSSKILAMGWKPRVPLEIGISIAYDDYRNRFCK